LRVIKCRKISAGRAEGLSLFSPAPISFFGTIDPLTSEVIEKNHPLYGQRIAGKILIYPTGRGSTVGSYVLYGLSRRGLAPKAIIMKEAEPIVAVGAIMADIPLVDRPESFDFKSGLHIIVDADRGEIIIP
jgi:predicted aconitase with swiveling domain